MGPNYPYLLAETPISHLFGHLPHTGGAVPAETVKPIFDSMPASDKEWVTETASNFDPNESQKFAVAGIAFGVSEQVAAGLIALLHQNV